MPKFKPMTPVYLRFWDHAKMSGSNASAISCELVGVYNGEDKISYFILSWLCDGVLDDNAEQYAIVKSAVTHIQPLKFSRNKKVSK